MNFLKKTNSNKKKRFRKNVSKKSLRKSALKKKLSGGAVPPGIMRQVMKSHYLVKCYKDLKDQGVCVETMPVKDLFNKCGGYASLDEDAGEAKNTISSLTLDKHFNFWSLEGWLNYLSSRGNVKSKRHAMPKGHIKNVVLSNGTKLGDPSNHGVQLAVLGTKNVESYKGELAKIFNMTLDRVTGEFMKENPGRTADSIKMKDVLDLGLPRPPQKAAEDTEDKPDKPLAPSVPDTCTQLNTKEVDDNELKRGGVDVSDKEGIGDLKGTALEEAKAKLKEYIGQANGGKSKRKTYKNTNKKKKK